MAGSYPMPYTDWAGGMAQIGQQVAGLGPVIDETIAHTQLKNKLANLRETTTEYVAENLSEFGNEMTPSQKKRFAEELSVINNPEEFVEKGHEFELQKQYRKEAGVKTLPVWGYTFAQYKAMADQEKARMGEEKVTGFINEMQQGRRFTEQPTPLMSQVVPPLVQGPQPQGALPEGEGEVPADLESALSGLPTPQSQLGGAISQEAQPEMQQIRQPYTAMEQQERLIQDPTIAGDPRAQAQIKLAQMKETEYDTKLKDAIAAMDKKQEERRKQLTTLSGISKGAAGHKVLFDVDVEAEELKDKQTQMKKILSGLAKSGTAREKAMKDAASIGLPADPDLISRELALVDKQIDKMPDYKKGLEEILEEERIKEEIDIASKSGGGDLANARQRQAALQAAEFSQKQKEMIGAVEEGKQLMSDLVTTYNKSGFGGAGSIIGEVGAQTPGIGKYLAPKYREYQKQREVVSETWLRAATGAATNKDEILRYADFLPKESDPPDLAQTKLDNFFTKIAVKAQGTAKTIMIEAQTLEKLNQPEMANAKKVQAQVIIDMVNKSRNAIPRIGETPEQTMQRVGQEPSIASMGEDHYKRLAVAKRFVQAYKANPSPQFKQQYDNAIAEFPELANQ